MFHLISYVFLFNLLFTDLYDNQSLRMVSISHFLKKKIINLLINQKSSLHLIVLNKMSSKLLCLSKKWTLDRVFYCMIPFPQFYHFACSAFDDSSVEYIKEQVFEVSPFSFPGRLQWQNVSPCLRSSVCLLVPRPGRIYSISLAKLQ